MADLGDKDKKYIVLRTLGKGSFGKVKEALHVISGEKIAIKILEKEKIKKDEDLQRIRREIEILSRVRHPNIIQLYEVIETSKYFFFVMEVAEKGELSGYIESRGRLLEDEACKFFHQLISVIKYLHSMGCAHRDVKPSNILIDWEYNIKVIDFGLGNLYDDEEKLKTACGSPCYAAPEIISGMDYNPLSVDIWSSGITLYAMLCGVLPFDEESKSILYDKILNCKYSIPKELSLEVSDLLKKLLAREPEDRLDISKILAHPWFKKHGLSADSPQFIKSGQKTPESFSTDESLLKLTSYKLNTDMQTILSQLQSNSHNKYTTLYYLLAKRLKKGDLEVEKEIQEIEENRLKKQQIEAKRRLKELRKKEELQNPEEKDHKILKIDTANLEPQFKKNLAKNTSSEDDSSEDAPGVSSKGASRQSSMSQGTRQFFNSTGQKKGLLTLNLNEIHLNKPQIQTQTKPSVKKTKKSIKEVSKSKSGSKSKKTSKELCPKMLGVKM